MRLGDLCGSETERLTALDGLVIDYIDISSVSNESKTVVGKQTLQSKEAPSRAQRILKPQDILVSTVRPNLNAVAVYDGSFENMPVASTGFCVLRCKPGVNHRFIFNICKSKAFIKSMTEQATGASYPAVNDKIIRAFEVPTAAYEHQEQLAARLDTVQRVIDFRKLQLQKLDELAKTRFVEMFGDPVSNPFGLPLKKLSELGSLDRGRSQHRPRNAPELLGGQYPLIQTGEVASAGLYITEFHNTYSEIGLKQSRMWKAGTLCITIAANIAQTSILTFDACFPDSVVGFVPTDEVSSLYIHYWFTFFQKILEEQAPQVAQKNINLKILSDLNVMVPSRDKLLAFENIVTQVDKSKLSIQASLDQLETLKQSLMQKYFG